MDYEFAIDVLDFIWVAQYSIEVAVVEFSSTDSLMDSLPS